MKANLPAAKAFVIDNMAMVLERREVNTVQTRLQKRRAKAAQRSLEVELLGPKLVHTPEVEPQEKEKLAQIEEQISDSEDLTNVKDLHQKQKEWEETHPPPTPLVSMNPELIQRFVVGYQTDPLFKHKWTDEKSSPNSWYTGK